jgi:outer membrane protein assembly factor BamD
MKKTVLLIVIVLLTVVSAKKEKNKGKRCSKRYNSGIEAFQKKHFGSAVSYLSDVRLDCIGGLDSEDSLYYLLGKSYMGGKKYAEARLEFRTIVEDYPQSEFVEESEYLMAYNSFRSAPIIQRENTILRRSQREFNRFEGRYPSSLWADSAVFYSDTISEMLVAKEFQSANYYEVVEKYESAIIYYKSIIEDYPNSKRLDEARFRIAWNLVRSNRFTEAHNFIKQVEHIPEFEDDIKKLNKTANKLKRKIEKKEAKRKKKLARKK